MISDHHVFDAIDAFEVEASAWRQHHFPDGCTMVEDSGRRLVQFPVADGNPKEIHYSRYDFNDKAEAQKFLFFKCMEAALRAVEKS